MSEHSKEEKLSRFLTFARAVVKDAKAVCANSKADPESQNHAFLVNECMREMLTHAPDFYNEDAANEPYSKREMFWIGYWAGSLHLGGDVIRDHPKRVRKLKSVESGGRGGEVRAADAEKWKTGAKKEIIFAWEEDKCRTNENLRDEAIRKLREKQLPCRGPDAVLLLVKELRRDEKIPKGRKAAAKKIKSRNSKKDII